MTYHLNHLPSSINNYFGIIILAIPVLNYIVILPAHYHRRTSERNFCGAVDARIVLCRDITGSRTRRRYQCEQRKCLCRCLPRIWAWSLEEWLYVCSISNRSLTLFFSPKNVISSILMFGVVIFLIFGKRLLFLISFLFILISFFVSSLELGKIYFLVVVERI